MSSILLNEVTAFAALAGNGRRKVCGLVRLICDEASVIRLIERVTRVFIHAAVNSHICTHIRDGLDIADGVQREAGLAHDGASRLNVNIRHLNTVLLAGSMHGFGNVAHVIFIRHGCIGFLVLYAEAAAEVEVCQRFAELCMDLVIELQHNLRRQHERGFVENLRADVAVQTDELYIFARDGFLYGFKRSPFSSAKPNLESI